MKQKILFFGMLAGMGMIVLILALCGNLSFTYQEVKLEKNVFVGHWVPVGESRIGDIGILPKGNALVVTIPRFKAQLPNVEMKDRKTMVVHLGEKEKDTIVIRYNKESSTISVSGEGAYAKAK